MIPQFCDTQPTNNGQKFPQRNFRSGESLAVVPDHGSLTSPSMLEACFDSMYLPPTARDPAKWAFGVPTIDLKIRPEDDWWSPVRPLRTMASRMFCWRHGLFGALTGGPQDPAEADDVLEESAYDGSESRSISPPPYGDVFGLYPGFYMGPYSISDSALSGVSSAMEASFSADELLELSDSVRESITKEGRLASSTPLIRQLVFFLESSLEREQLRLPSVDFSTIKFAHLDRLLDDIIEFDQQRGSQSAKTFSYVGLARALQRAWQSKFRNRYFMLNELRSMELESCGRLRRVEFVTPVPLSPLSPISDAWKASDMSPLNQLDSQFRIGQWWLNIACAHRDGIVGSEGEKPTRGKYGNSALPLLTGSEEIIKESEVVRYMREGTLADMHPSLLTHTGKPIRILRGFQLRSSYAPKAGLRYDGLWKLTSYRQHRDVNTNVYHLQLTLERVSGQYPPMEKLIKIPRPSQMDDWTYYEKLQNQKIKNTTGSEGLFSFQVQLEEDRRDREESRRIRDFRSSIGAGPLKPLSGTNGLGLGITFKEERPDVVIKAPVPQRGSSIRLRRQPAMQTKRDQAERQAMQEDGMVKKAAIDTSLNKEYKSRSRSTGRDSPDRSRTKTRK